MNNVIAFPDTFERQVISLYAGERRIENRKAEAFEALQRISNLRCTLASWETLLLDRIARGGFSYSDEADAADNVREAANALFPAMEGEKA